VPAYQHSKRLGLLLGLQLHFTAERVRRGRNGREGIRGGNGPKQAGDRIGVQGSAGSSAACACGLSLAHTRACERRGGSL
jgi:hypothetical protein